MKNGLLIWNVILTLGIGYLLFAQFGGKKQRTGSVSEKEATGKTTSPFKIGYFVMDSVENNFEMVKEIKGEISKKDEEYGNDVSKLDLQMRKRAEDYKRKLPTMSPEEQQNEVMQLQQLEAKLRGDKQELDNSYQQFVMTKNLSIKMEIEKYLADFTKDRNFSYVMSYEPGIFFYKDTAYDITADLIRGLNATYKKSK